MHNKPPRDRRVRKTRALLLEALASLLHEKPYEAIAVKEILDRANVGRSTFYTHFRDKDGLLSSTVGDVLGQRSSAPAPTLPHCERVLCFSLPVLEHIDRQRRRAGGRPRVLGMGWRERQILHGRLEREIARSITDEVRSGIRQRARTSDALPAELLVRHVTSTFIMVLTWWIESRSPLTPEAVDARFRALVRPVLAEALG